MSNFFAGLGQLSVPEKNRLQEVLTNWSVGPLVAQAAETNLQADGTSPDVEFVTYLKELAANATKLTPTLPGVGSTFEKLGKSFAFDGHDAGLHSDALFGRAILLEKYARYLRQTFATHGLPCNQDQSGVIEGLRELHGVSEADANEVQRTYLQGIRLTPLGRAPVFATFARTKDKNHPWQPIPAASWVRTNVALGEDPTGKDYLLFVYKLPASVRPHVPTTASPGWFYQRWFRPHPGCATDRHGLTAPLDGGVAGLPEIVHNEIDGRTISFPVFIAAA